MITIRSIISRFYSTVSRGGSKGMVAIAVLMFASLWSLGWYRYSNRWRIWKPDEVPVAFWAWHSEAPGENDVNRAVNEARADTLFLRAGQIDLEGGRLRRIRAVEGKLPANIDIHLVYNATRACQAEFERLDPAAFAGLLSETYQVDASRAVRDGARVAGIQLDFDVPTRLLGRYRSLLKSTRQMLPSEIRLSITGLVTWMDSPALQDTLEPVDFWIPQCYGATIPESLSESQSQPVSSATMVARAIARARGLNCSYYAGLAAYGYAIQYDQNGSLIALRGDLDPALIANDSNFDLVNRGPFEPSEGTLTGRWRCVYRARNEGVIDGTALHALDYLMLDVPTAASLREAARIVREQGGDNLLGICVFRLPRRNDPTALTIEEVARALSGEEPASSFQIESKLERELEGKSGAIVSRLRLRIVNDGSARSRLDAGAMALFLSVPAASVATVSVHGFSSVESYGEASGLDNNLNPMIILRPCTLNRATVLTFSGKQWLPGQEATAVIGLGVERPQKLRVSFEVTLDDGKVIRRDKAIDLGSEE
ncbi:MAG TPA: DUF3142 domain-containing protein [Blastocatellia bacterium]|nr:DUF3142 domain-containing protein [Blastocatellia bacterium]